MTLDQKWELAQWAGFLVPLLATLLLLFFCPWPRRTWARLVLSVFIGWIFLFVLHETVVHPVWVERAVASGKPYGDGVAANAAALMLGWFEPLLAALLALGCRALWRRIHPTTHAPNTPTRNA